MISHFFIRVGLTMSLLFVSGVNTLAAKLDSTAWLLSNYSGNMAPYLNQPLLPPANIQVGLQSTAQPNLLQATTNLQTAPASNLITNLTDNNLSTFTTLSNPATILIDMVQTNAVDRVTINGSTNQLNVCSGQWPNYSQNSAQPPLGLINIYVGNTPTNSNLVAAYTVPYDAGNPIETEVDARFSPAVGRYVRISLQTQVAWGSANWPGWALNSQPPATNVDWNVGEVELYGFIGTNAQIKADAVVINANSPAPLALAANDLSYYLGELEGRPVPIITPAVTNNYPGTLYVIRDLAPLAPNFATMMTNIASGLLPTNINVQGNGRSVVFSAWPYRAVLWSVWGFLEQQGVRWVYPDAHGDFVPTGKGVNLSILPYAYNPPTYSIYANFDINVFEPWPIWMSQSQSLSQGFLYLWRNHWTFSENGYGPLGGSEIPKLPIPNINVNSNYLEGFSGYPHNFSSVVPNRLLDSNASPYTNWWGWATTNVGSRTAPSISGAPVFTMDDPTLIYWVANKMTNVAAAQPLDCVWPLNICHIHRPFNLLPLDASIYSQDPFTIASNGPAIADSVPWVKLYNVSYSGMYYSFVNSVARQVQQSGSGALVGALAYADVFLPPTNITTLAIFPTNVQVEVCLYGSPNLSMTAPANIGLKAALDGWHGACSHLATYDYTLLHSDYWQPDPRLPVPLIAGMVSHSQYLASIGAMDGGCQATTTSLRYNPWNFYAYPRARWNTNQTTDQIEQEFFVGYYREAAVPMLAYYKAMENWQYTNNVDMHYMGYCYWATPGSFPLHILSQMQTNLLAAQLLATNWYVINRLNDASNCFNWLLSNLQVTNPEAMVSFLIFPTVPTTGTYTLNDKNFSNAPQPNNYFYYPNSYSGITNFNGAAQIRQTLNFTAPGNYLITVSSCAGYNNGWPSMRVFLGASCSDALTITNTSYITNSFVAHIPVASAFDVVITQDKSGKFLHVSQVQITKQ